MLVPAPLGGPLSRLPYPALLPFRPSHHLHAVLRRSLELENSLTPFSNAATLPLANDSNSRFAPISASLSSLSAMTILQGTADVNAIEAPVTIKGYLLCE